MPNEQPKIPEPRPVTVVKSERQLSTIRFTPCGKFLFAAGRDAKIYRWNFDIPDPPVADVVEAVDNKKKNAKAPKPPEPVFPELPPLSGHDGWVSTLAIHPTRQHFYSADTWGRLIGWSYAEETPKPIWNVANAHDGWVRQLALSADGERLATCGKDKAVRIWSTPDGKKLQEFANQAEDTYSVAFHPDGKSLVVGDLKGVVWHWDLAQDKVVREFDAKILYMLSFIQDVGGVRVLAFDPGGKTLAIAGAQPAGGGFVQATPIVKFFNWEDAKELQTLKLGDNTEGFVLDLAVHSENYWIGVCSGQPGKGRFFFHRVGEAQPFFTKALTNCHSLAIRPGGERLAVISNAGTFGQQKSMARQGIYPGNSSPVNVFDLPKATA